MPLQSLFAILRFEDDADPNIPFEHRVSVTGVVQDLPFGRQEVDRLNRLNGRKGYRYFLKTTRLKQPGEKHE